MSENGRGVRELSDILEMSPAGVHDILRRLKTKGIVSASRRGGRMRYSLTLDGEDRGCLEALMAYLEAVTLSAKAKSACRESAARMKWVSDNLSSLSEL